MSHNTNRIFILRAIDYSDSSIIYDAIVEKKGRASFMQRISKGKYKIISFYAKKARGLMTAWILKNKIKENELKNFNVDGYYFAKEESSENSPVFLRD